MKKSLKPQTGEALIKFRMQNDLTQGALAKIMGVTQAHISRIEKGARVSEHLFSKISRLLEGEISVSNASGDDGSFNFKVQHDKIYNWSIAQMSYPEPDSGDMIEVIADQLQTRTHVLHCDAVGADLGAAKDAYNLKVAFQATVNTLSCDGLTGSERIYFALNKTIKKNKKLWRDKPSANIITLFHTTGRVEYINAGMPNMLLFNYVKKEIIDLRDGDLWPPVGRLRKNSEMLLPSHVMLAKGDVLFAFSDGFIGNFNALMTPKLKTQLLALSKSQRGDSNGIARRLVKNFNQSLRFRSLNDDVSFVVISNN